MSLRRVPVAQAAWRWVRKLSPSDRKRELAKLRAKSGALPPFAHWVRRYLDPSYDRKYSS